MRTNHYPSVGFRQDVLNTLKQCKSLPSPKWSYKAEDSKTLVRLVRQFHGPLYCNCYIVKFNTGGGRILADEIAISIPIIRIGGVFVAGEVMAMSASFCFGFNLKECVSTLEFHCLYRKIHS